MAQNKPVFNDLLSRLSLMISTAPLHCQPKLMEKLRIRIDEYERFEWNINLFDHCNQLLSGAPKVHLYAAPSTQWTVLEDIELQWIVSLSPMPANWSSIAISHQTRSADECRERWESALDPCAMRDLLWGPGDEEMLMNVHARLTADHSHRVRWEAVADQMPGRTGAECRSHYQMISRRRGMGREAVHAAQVRARYDTSFARIAELETTICRRMGVNECKMSDLRRWAQEIVEKGARGPIPRDERRLKVSLLHIVAQHLDVIEPPVNMPFEFEWNWDSYDQAFGTLS
jgi:hypothetical protein